MNPRAYIKRHDENIKEIKKKLAVVVEPKDEKVSKSGRKSKQEKEVETRMKQQAAFLLFLEKEKNKADND